MQRTLIYGAGPRGLSACLYLHSLGIKPTLIDPNPISSWSESNILSSVIMRSPSTFDLVTNLPNLQDFSLSNFLDLNVKYSDKQKDIEADRNFISRKEFCSYLTHILNYLINQGCSLLQEEIISISKSSITTTLQTLEYDHLIIANGNAGATAKKPNWLHSSSLSTKIISQKEAIVNPPSGVRVAVVGSGQGASEFAYELSKNNNVTWIKTHQHLVYQYPGPGYDLIGYKSVLGNYYSNYVKLDSQRKAYKEYVSKYTPTITPHIAKLIESSSITQVIPNIITRELIDSFDVVLSICGFQPDIKTLPLNFEASLFYSDPRFPYLRNFKMPNTSIYFTGILASMYDGPRQNSIISSGLTSKTIAEDILCQT